jgi:hypothetical protein
MDLVLIADAEEVNVEANERKLKDDYVEEKTELRGHWVIYCIVLLL